MSDRLLRFRLRRGTSSELLVFELRSGGYHVHK